MIVELTQAQVAELLCGVAVTIGDVTVRQGDGVVLNEAGAAPDVRERRTDARQQLKGEPIFWMHAKFDSKCPHAFCATGRIERGERVLRDTIAEKTYCGPCGRDLHPNVRDPKAVNA